MRCFQGSTKLTLLRLRASDPVPYMRCLQGLNQPLNLYQCSAVAPAPPQGTERTSEPRQGLSLQLSSAQSKSILRRTSLNSHASSRRSSRHSNHSIELSQIQIDSRVSNHVQILGVQSSATSFTRFSGRSAGVVEGEVSPAAGGGLEGAGGEGPGTGGRRRRPVSRRGTVHFLLVPRSATQDLPSPKHCDQE